MTEQIAAVRSDLDVENRIAWEKIGNRRANFCFRRQNQQARGVFAQAELNGAAQHSFRIDAAQFAFSNFGPVRQFRAWEGQRNFIADFIVGGAANDLSFRAAPVIHFANGESIRIRMARRRGNLRNKHLLDLRAAGFDVFGLDSGARQQIGDLFRSPWKIDKFAQPIN